MEIVVATCPDRENLIAEIVDQSYAWADVRYDDRKEAYEVTLYPPGDEDPVVFDLAEMRRMLVQAKEALVARGYPDLSVCDP